MWPWLPCHCPFIYICMLIFFFFKKNVSNLHGTAEVEGVEGWLCTPNHNLLVHLGYVCFLVSMYHDCHVMVLLFTFACWFSFSFFIKNVSNLHGTAEVERGEGCLCTSNHNLLVHLGYVCFGVKWVRKENVLVENIFGNHWFSIVCCCLENNIENVFHRLIGMKDISHYI
jgi:hypothetical protein